MSFNQVCKSVESAIARLEVELREHLVKFDQKADYDFKITINRDWSWGANKASIKIEYEVYAGGEIVRGATIQAVVQEWQRRKGWTDQNKASSMVLLETSEQREAREQADRPQTLDEEIPF